MCVNISSIKRIFSNQSHYFPDIPCIYSTNIVVMVPIIWLYITAVVVKISFSIIALCIFISLLLVTVGIMYIRMGNSINVAINILFEGENKGKK